MYNVVPDKMGGYFNKIQCFCFEQQRLRAGETVDMPVFFYIDPEMTEDFNLRNCHDVTLAYTFYKVDDADLDEEDLERGVSTHACPDLADKPDVKGLPQPTDIKGLPQPATA